MTATLETDEVEPGADRAVMDLVDASEEHLGIVLPVENGQEVEAGFHFGVAGVRRSSFTRSVPVSTAASGGIAGRRPDDSP